MKSQFINQKFHILFQKLKSELFYAWFLYMLISIPSFLLLPFQIYFFNYHNKQFGMKPVLPISNPGLRTYRDRVKMRFKKQVQDIVMKHSLSQLVIVLDSSSSFLLSSIFSVTQFVAMKILYIESLQVKRKKLDKHALYFINPTKPNIQLLVKDFPPLSQEEQPQYRRIHILLTTFIEKGLMKTLALQKSLLKRIAKNSFKQFYFSNRILASSLIDLNQPYLSLAFSKKGDQQEYIRRKICKKFIQLIANYEEVNTVRIFYKKSPNKICQFVSNTLKEEITNYFSILLENRSPNISKEAPELTILLLDRSIDTVTPFIHYFTYQSLLFDLLNVDMVSKKDLKDKGSYSYEEIQNSTYDQYRYKHISVALAKLPEEVQDQKGNLQKLKLVGNETINIRQLTEKIGQIKSNIQKLESIWKIFKDKNIEELADLQQSIATGITGNSQNTSSVKLIGDVISQIQKSYINREQKLRLAILCLSCIKMSKEDYEKLYELFNTEDKKVLKNMIALGVTYDGSITKSTKTVTKDQQKIAEKRIQQTGMYLNRYTSIVQLVLPLFCSILQNPQKSEKIDKQVFGEVSCSIFEGERGKFKRDRFAMAMLGGLSWSEVSAIRGVAEMEDIILMSDSILTAPELIDEISRINILKQ